MDFIKTKLYDHNSIDSSLTMYDDPPNQTISLVDFEPLVLERLEVMKQLQQRTFLSENENEIIDKLGNIIRNTHLQLNSMDNYIHDNISHWILRMVMASSVDLREMFLSFEVLLLKYRFSKRTSWKEVNDLMNKNNFTFQPITKLEKKEYRKQLEATCMLTQDLSANRSFETIEFYKVPFYLVLNLVSHRQVFISKGFAFVQKKDIISMLLTCYRIKLSKRLAMLYRKLPYIREDERVNYLFEHLSKNILHTNYKLNVPQTKNGDRIISCENIDQLVRHMPLCMREMHAALKRDHHLKYHGRFQLQLFMKGIGLSLTDCLRYFQKEFSKGSVSVDQFNKRYAYSIRHLYGQEGKRKQYEPYDCFQLITSVQPLNPSEHHGCPFKIYSSDYLRSLLLKKNSPEKILLVDEIMSLVEQKNYGHACKKHFEILHNNKELSSIIAHPNMWFDESYHYFEEQSSNNLFE